MKAIHVTAIGDPEVKTIGKTDLWDIPNKEPGDEEVMLKVAYASICGSDGHILRGNLGPLREMVLSWLPMRLGHEVSGVIEKAGKKALELGFKPGDRVTANYVKFCNSCYYCRNGQENLCQHPEFHYEAMGQYVTWHMSQIYKIPEHVSLKDAALTEPLSIALNAVETVNIKMGARVAVMGAGGIGLMAVQLAKMAGASSVSLFDIVDSKLQLGKQLGADMVFNTSDEDCISNAMDYTEERGYDNIIETTGNSNVAKMALDLLTMEGHVVYIAMYNENFELPLNLFAQMYQKGLHIHGMQTSADTFEKTVRMLGRVNLSSIIQKTYLLEEHKEAFDAQLTGAYTKIAFKCNDDLE